MPVSVPIVIVGAGVAGASTAWALGRAGAGPGLILEREPMYGAHASGRNAGIVRLTEDDPMIRALARRSIEHLSGVEHEGRPIMRRTGGVTLAPAGAGGALAPLCDGLREEGIDGTEVQTAACARARFPCLRDFEFEAALWCPAEGVVDVHALLTHYLQEARGCGFSVRPRSGVDGLLVEGGRVAGVRTGDEEIRAEIVVDASGAWAGQLGAAPLPLQPFRRHLCTTGPAEGWERESPYVWVWESEFYCRPEADGLLMSPCDATPLPASTPAADPAIGELLAAKLARHAPGLLELPLRRSWPCLRTFAPDHRPFVGADPSLAGLYHVSGLGGFGMMTSAAVGELAAAAILGRRVDWIDPAAVSPARR